MRKKARFFAGLLLFVVGVVLLLNSFSGMTGFVVFENVGQEVSGVLGIVFVVLGILFIIGRREHPYHFRGRSSLRRHNAEAWSAAVREYRAEFHRNPSKTELRAYLRAHHDEGDIPNIVGKYQHKPTEEEN